jgi:hypothetical protein
MIRPDGFRGAAFGDAADGNARSDPSARRRMSDRLGIPMDWAWLRQVHGADVVRVVGAGPQGVGDAAYTSVRGLPIAVSTADCYPVIVESPDAVGIAHAGWRGAATGVVEALLRGMAAAGHEPARAAIGPGIGACCFEVGPEVGARFRGHEATTDWGTTAVDLSAVVRAALGDLEVWATGICTMSNEAYHSHRRDATPQRQVAVTWLPA